MGAAPRPQDTRRRRGGFRARLLVSFVVPVLILGAGAAILIEVLFAGARELGGLPRSAIYGILGALFLLAVLVAAALALQAGDRFTRPVAWLLRAIDAGQIRQLSQVPPPTGDWEMAALCSRVRVLLRQNLSGAAAMEELEALRSEIEALLDGVDGGRINPDRLPRECSAHPLTQRLVGFFQMRADRVREAEEGIARLQGLLEQDWREETQAIEEIVKRTEACFLQQTQVAVELERLERLLGSAMEKPAKREGALQLLEDLRMGIEHWRREIDVLLHHGVVEDGGALSSPVGDEGGPEPQGLSRGRLREWDAWVQESLGLLEKAVDDTTTGADGRQHKIALRLEKVASEVAGSSQEVSALSREAIQLQRAWTRLSERMRTLMVRAAALHNGSRGVVTSLQGETERGAAD